MGERKGSAVAELAADLGKGVAHTGANPAEREIADAMADLFSEMDEAADDFAGAAAPPPVRRPGRPPGSLSRSTKQLQAWAAHRGYRDPAELLLAVESADTRTLAASLLGRPLTNDDGDFVLKVFDIQIKAAREAMPYFRQQMPKQIEFQGERPRALIVINEAGGGIRAPGSRGGLSIHDIEPIQQVSGPEAQQSHGSTSHGEDQAIDDAAQSKGQADD